MSIVIVPDSLKAKLEAADGPMTLYMSDGRILGLFTPTTGPKLDLEPPPLPPGELERREAAGGGRPLKVILRDLESAAR